MSRRDTFVYIDRETPITLHSASFPSVLLVEEINIHPDKKTVTGVGYEQGDPFRPVRFNLPLSCVDQHHRDDITSRLGLSR